MAESFQAPAQISPEQIIDSIFRGKWIIIIPLCISLTIGLYATLTAKKIYQSKTMILVQPQRVPTGFVRSIVTSSMSQRVGTISQQIMSRSNLEKIIDQFGLYENAEELYMEEKVAGMRKKIKVKIEHSRGGSEAFSISYQGSEPQRVMRIANTLASYFMDENLKVREAQAIGTSEFLNSELEKTRKQLEEREQRLSAYRVKYMGGLPSELGSNLRKMDRLQRQIADKNQIVREAKNGLNILENQIAQSKEMTSQTFDDQFDGFDFEEEDSFGGSKNQNKLSQVKNQRDNLLLKYTQKHPDVARLKKIIENLEKAIEEERKEVPLEDESGENNSQDMELMPNYAAIQQEMQLKQIKNEIQKNQSYIGKIEQQMKMVQKLVEDTPRRELEMQSLKRDYGNIKSTFNSLLKRKLEAELSLNMEKKQKGEQFKILDHARMPEKPISPNVKVFFTLSVASGLGIGVGILILWELMGFSIIRREDQIEKELRLTILATIPRSEKPKDKVKQKILWIAFIGCGFYASVFLVFFTILNTKGLDRTLNFIKMNLNI